MAKDTLSALLDGECSPGELDRLLDDLERSPELKAQWSRLCLTRDAVEGTRVQRDQPCICSGVMQRLEPVAGMPAAVPRGRPKVVPLVARRMRSYWKPAIGLAAAASVGALAMTLSLDGVRDTASPVVPGFSPQISTPVSIPVSNSRSRYLQTVSATPQDVQRAVFEDDLRSYLIEHSSVADRGMAGTLSYARFAAHTADQVSLTPEGQP